MLVITALPELAAFLLTVAATILMERSKLLSSI